MATSNPLDPARHRKGLFTLVEHLFTLVEHLITQVAEILDRFGARWAAVSLIVVLVALLFYACGLLSLEQLQEWRRMLFGGS